MSTVAAFDIEEFVEMFLSLADSARLTQSAVGVPARGAIGSDPRHPVWPHPDGTAYGSHQLTPEGFQRLLVMSNVAGWWLGDEFVGLDRRELLADATFSARPTGAGLWLPAAKNVVKASRHEIARLQWRVESATLRKPQQLAPFLTRVDTSPARAEDFNLNRALVNRSDHSWGWPESMRITFDSSELRSGEESTRALMSIVNAWSNYGAEGGFDAVGPFHGLTGEHWDDNSYTWTCDFGYTSPEALEIALIDLHRSVQYWATGNLFFGPVRLAGVPQRRWRRPLTGA